MEKDLESITQTTAMFLIEITITSAKNIISGLKKIGHRNIGRDKFDKLFVDILFFKIHLFDRVLCNYIPLEKDIFMDNLLENIQKGLGLNWHMHTTLFDHVDTKKYLNCITDDLYNEKQLEYGSYRLFTKNENEGLEGDLFWEFGKKIMNYLFPQVEIPALMYIYGIANGYLGITVDFIEEHFLKNRDFFKREKKIRISFS